MFQRDMITIVVKIITVEVMHVKFRTYSLIQTVPLFTKRTDALPQDLVKSRSRKMHV